MFSAIKKLTEVFQDTETKTKEEHLAEVKKYSAANYKPLAVVISRGEGVWVWDNDNKKYLDALSAYSAVNQGHRHPKIIEALKTQADRLTLSSRAFHNDQMGSFLKLLCETTGYEQALPMNTGAEAVETAIKMVRKWGYEQKGVAENQAEIIVCENNFHGRTTTIISFSTEAQYREGFGPFTPGFKVIPYGDAQALRDAITPNTVGFLFEPIQGEGGVIIPKMGYLADVRKICSENRVLMIADEIQTGLGRTGRLFCYEHENNAKPDVVILGKALGGGVFPVSATLTSHEIMSVFRPGDHGSTFGGNPLAAAVGRASLEVLLEENLPERSMALGEYLLEKLKALPLSHAVREIRGRGLMIGIELKREFGTARAICEKLADLGVLAKDTHEQTIRITPPLVIRKEEIDWLFDRIKEAFGVLK